MRRDLKPDPSRPKDFNSFWDSTLSELARTPANLLRERLNRDQEQNLVLERISFESLWAAKIEGYFLHAADDGPRPLVIHTHGYGSQCEVQWAWARAGLDVVGVDIRGFGRSVDAVPQPSPYGYMLTGWRSPETHVLRGAICDFVRAVELARRELAPAHVRTVLRGSSFAGGLALMAEALTQAADFLCIAVPTFGWAEGRQILVKSGSGKEISDFLHGRPEAAEDLMLVLRYFDPLNFAERITCPTLVGVGLSDDVVPAETVYAIANHISAAHAIREFPVSHSEEPDEVLWEQFEQEWLTLARNGIPKGFGSSAQSRNRSE